MLSCCDADGEILSVLEFFAVGKTFRALFWCAVKGGGHCQCLNISAIFKVHLCRVPRLSVFINPLTLPCFFLLLRLYLYYRKSNRSFPCLGKQRCLLFLYLRYKNKRHPKSVYLINPDRFAPFFLNNNKIRLQIPCHCYFPGDPHSDFLLFYPICISVCFYEHAAICWHHSD